MMAIVIASSITDVIEVDSQKDFSKEKQSISNNDSDISENISRCDDMEVHNRDVENIEGSLKTVVCNTILSNSNIDNREQLQINETSNLPDNSHLNNEIELNEFKENKLRVNDICNNEDNDNDINKERLSRRFLDLVDSDSEEETNNYESLDDKSITTNIKHLSKSSEHLQVTKYKKTSRSLRRINSESEDDLQINNTDDILQANKKIEDNNILINSKSEDEKEEIACKSVDALDNVDVSEENKTAKEKSIKKRKGSMRAAKDEAMRQIHSETQRLLRETEISLPYHRPRQRTLQEFLNRKKIIVLPKAPSMAAKVKMSSLIVSQVVAEREKEAEFFYKSSDSEDEMKQLTNKESTNKDIKNSSMENDKILSTITKYSSVKDKKNNQESCIEEEIKQNQFDVTVRISQKDFCEINDQDKAPLLSSLTKNNRNDLSNILPQQILIESNQDVQKSSVVRKLFDPNYNNTTSEAFDTSHNKQQTSQIIETMIETAITLDNEDNTKVYDNKEISEKLKKKDCVTNNITTMSNDYIIQNENNEKQDDCVEIDDTSQSLILINDTSSKNKIDKSAEKYEASNGHIFGLPLPNDITTDEDKQLPESILNRKVKLKGGPGMIIDLTHDIKPNKKGINALLDRFFNKHITTKKQVDDKSEVTVVHLQDTQSGPVPIKKVLPYKLPTNIDNSELNKPGAKLKRLKEDLKLQMTLKRNEQWKQKKIEQQAEEKEEWDEEKEIDDSEQERASDFESSDSEESEPEENDVYLKDKKRKKCLFADDEAEVTDDEASNISTEETDNESDVNQMEHIKQSTNNRHGKKYMDNANEIETDQEEKEEEEYEDLNAHMENESESDSQDTDNININKNKKDKKTKQLMREFQDVLDIGSQDLENKSNQLKNIMTDIDVSKKYSENNDSISENESNISVYQQNIELEICTKSQICKTPLVKTSMLDFVSPITQLSVLNTTLSSNKKDSLGKNDENLINKDESMESSQYNESFERVSDIRNKTISKKRLFDDNEETIDDEYLMKLCSGKFESTQSTKLHLKYPSSQFNVTESQLCPRNLNTKSVDIKQSKNVEANNKTSQNINVGLMLAEDSNKSVNYAEKEKEVKKIEELKLIVVSSDDDDQSNETFFKSKRRSMKKFILSDSEEEKEKEEEEEDMQSYEENDDTDNENVEKYIDYDSEENEMIIVPKKDIKKVAADFLEEEAELSESDWNSADEDEKDMDKLEFEEGDNEHIDEHKVRDELGKIHMKQILDEDKREVRFLKELLFEDGDLHTDGAGRERKFKWRNIDKIDDNSEMHQVSNENDGWVDVQEDEEEAKWSKFRRERDKFLEEREKCSNNDIEDDFHNSKIFKLGLEALKKIENNKSKKQDISSNKIDPSENMEPIMPQSMTDLMNGSITGKKSQTTHNIMKKCSFLTRGEESLARLVSLAKQGDSISHMVKSRNFVFQYIDRTNDVSKDEKKNREEKNQELQNKSGKRKSTSDFSLTMKKKRKYNIKSKSTLKN